MPAGRQAIFVSAITFYSGPYDGGFWGGFWGYGRGTPYISRTTHVYMETLFYSLEQNKLVWAGKSKTTNPSNVASVVRDLVTSAVWEMNRANPI